MANQIHVNRNRYDKTLLNQIPILDVASRLGLPISMRAGKPWTRIRPEDHTPSVQLRLDKNTFRDFGGDGRHGDVIELVRYSLNLSFSDAVEWLAQQYNISSINKSTRNTFELSDWEYEKIGLYADRASKNISFDLTKMDSQKAAMLSFKYAASMNELRKEDPKAYAGILITKAIPYVSNLRNEYLLSVWSLSELCKEISSDPSFFKEQCRANYLDDKIKDLESAEKILFKAARGTQVKAWKPRVYDPVTDLAKMTEGLVKPKLGTLSYNQMESYSKKECSNIEYTIMSWREYESNSALQSLPHTAFLSKGSIIVGFLTEDSEQIMDIIRSQTSSLEDRVAEIESSQPNHKPITKPRMEEVPKCF